MAKLEMKQQRPAETNAIKYLGEDVHAVEISAVADRTQHADD